MTKPIACLRSVCPDEEKCWEAERCLHPMHALSPPEPTEGQIAEIRAALKPFADFAEKAEAFVAARAKDGESPIMPSSDFRLADFKRADAALRSMPLQEDAK